MKIHQSIQKFFVLMSCFVLVTCSSYDLGESGNYYFNIGEENIANPVWEKGINQIVEKKCATCHTTTTPWYKPKNVPSFPNAETPIFGLDYIGSKDFFDSKNSLLVQVKKCIETKDSRCGKEQIPMPPNYATPLDNNERTALVNYVNALLPKAIPGELSAHFTTNCAGCHPKASGYGSAASANKKIGESQSDTFDKYKNTYKTLAPMPNNGGSTYTDADALADWKFITGK